MIALPLIGVPKFLGDTGYANSTDPNHAPWHVGHQTEKSPFLWLNEHPELLSYFLPWMAGQRDGMPIFLDSFDFKKEVLQGKTPTDESTPLFVDVGGAMGHQCLAFKERRVDVPGRVILQEQHFVVDQVKSSPLPGFDGIEAEAYNFFKPETIRGKQILSTLSAQPVRF